MCSIRGSILYSLFQDRNKVSLRNLSMVLRQEQASSAEERTNNIQQGVDYAKEAVSLDTTDGTSWAILGNAYLSSFFTVVQSPTTLRLCMSAYMQAVSHQINHNHRISVSSRMRILAFVAGEGYHRQEQSGFVLQQSNSKHIDKP